MPKIIYKPKTNINTSALGTREKSQRERKVNKKFQVEHPKKSKKEKLERKRLAHWTLKEKPAFYKQVKEHGTADLSVLLDHPDLKKSEDQIKEMIHFQKKANKMVEVLKVDAKSANDKIWVPKEIDNAIEAWISLAEIYKVPHNSMDCSHILSDTLSVIINEEKHPDPEQCQGVDYAQIYKFLHDILNGELPKEPTNKATASKILELMAELREMVALAKPSITDELTMLERYTIRDLAAHNLPFAGKCQDKTIEALAETPKINPLQIPASFFSKKILRKESD